MWKTIFEKHKTLIFSTVGFIIFFSYILAINPFKVFTEIRKVDYALYALAVFVDLLGVIFFGLAWHILLRGIGVEIKVKESVGATLFSLFTVALIPIPMGSELIRIAYAKEKKNSNSGKALTTVLVHRIMYNLAFMLMITFAIFMVKVAYGYSLPVESRIILSLMGFAGGCIVAFMVALNAKLLRKLYKKYQNRIENYIKRYILKYASNLDINNFENVFDEIEETMTKLGKNKFRVALAFVMISFHWSTGALTTYIVAKALDYPLSFWLLVAIYAVIEFIQELNIVIPGSIGIIEPSLTMVLMAVGVPLHISAAITILTRLATYWIEKLFCGLVSIYYGFTRAGLIGFRGMES